MKFIQIHVEKPSGMVQYFLLMKDFKIKQAGKRHRLAHQLKTRILNEELRFAVS
jgi:hypothetical protein